MAQAMIDNPSKGRQFVKLCVLTSAIRRFGINYPQISLADTERYIDTFAKDMYYAMGKFYANMPVCDKHLKDLSERNDMNVQFDTYCAKFATIVFRDGYDAASFLLYVSWISYFAFKLKEWENINVIETAIDAAVNIWTIYMNSGEFELVGGWLNLNETAAKYHGRKADSTDEDTSDELESDKEPEHDHYQEIIDELKHVDEQDIGGEQNTVDIQDNGGEQKNVDEQDIGGERKTVDKQDIGGEQKTVDIQDNGGEQKNVDEQDIGGERKAVDKQDIGGEQKTAEKQDNSGE